MNTFVTQLKREYWENRGGFFWAPFVVAAAFIAIIALSLIATQININNADLQIMGVQISKLRINMPATVRPEIANGIQIFLSVSALLIHVVLGFVLFFYFLASLFDERKDRSVLFWKSMPVSDLQTVLSKIFAAMFIAPLFALAASILFQFALLILASSFLAFNGVNAWKLLLVQTMPLKLWATLLAGIPVNAVWALPTIGWLMLVSAWARGKPFLWAVLVPLTCGVMLTIFDAMSSLAIPDTWYWNEIFWRGLGSVFPWSFDPTGAFRFGINVTRDTSAGELVSFSSLFAVMTSFKTLLGAAIGAAMIAGAVYMRRYRELID